MAPVEALPSETLVELLQYLNVDDWVRCARVCTKLRAVATCGKLFQREIQARLGAPLLRHLAQVGFNRYYDYYNAFVAQEVPRTVVQCDLKPVDKGGIPQCVRVLTAEHLQHCQYLIVDLQSGYGIQFPGLRHSVEVNGICGLMLWTPLAAPMAERTRYAMVHMAIRRKFHSTITLTAVDSADLGRDAILRKMPKSLRELAMLDFY